MTRTFKSLAACSLLFSFSVLAAATSSSSNPGISPESSAPFLPEKTEKKETLKPKKIIPLNLPHATDVDIYTSPGVVGYANAHWLGSDHLINVPKNVGIAIELVQDQQNPAPLQPNEFRSIISTSLSKVGITPEIKVDPGLPPLPFIHLLIISETIPEGYVLSCTLSFIEAAKMIRVVLPSTLTWQVISWQKQTLVIANPADIQGQTAAAVDDLISSFSSRYRYFQDLTRPPPRYFPTQEQQGSQM